MQTKCAAGMTLMLTACLVASGLAMPRSAEARPCYKKVWEEVYRDAASKLKVDCALCHPGKDKKEFNKYGEALKKALGGNNHCNDLEKVAEAIRKLHKKKCDCGEWGERIEKGTAPCEEKASSKPVESTIERLLRRREADLEVPRAN